MLFPLVLAIALVMARPIQTEANSRVFAVAGAAKTVNSTPQTRINCCHCRIFLRRKQNVWILDQF
jgi:hypothetical protein